MKRIYRFNAWCPLESYTILNLQISATGLFKYMWPYGGHQALKGKIGKPRIKFGQCNSHILFQILYPFQFFQFSTSIVSLLQIKFNLDNSFMILY